LIPPVGNIAQTCYKSAVNAGIEILLINNNNTEFKHVVSVGSCVQIGNPICVVRFYGIKSAVRLKFWKEEQQSIMKLIVKP